MASVSLQSVSTAGKGGSVQRELNESVQSTVVLKSSYISDLLFDPSLPIVTVGVLDE